MNDRRVTGTVLAALGAVVIALGCSSAPAPGGAVGARRAALQDGGAPLANTEYSVFVVPALAPAPAPRMHPSLAFDTKAGAAVLTFGVGDAVNGFADTWTYDGAWKKACDAATCAAHPPGRYLSALAYVPDRGVTVAFGGVSRANDYLCDTWEWETATTTWTRKANPACDQAIAKGRAGHAAAAFGSRALLFGGIVYLGPTSTPRTNELLSWDGNAWSLACDADCVARSAAVPSPRAYASLVHAKLARGDVLYLFGGSVATQNGNSASNDLWEFDVTSARWTELCTGAPCSAERPPAREQQGAAYDPVRRRVVVHGGCNTACTEVFSDAWEYDPEASRWGRVPPPIAPGLPAAKSSFGIAFDSKRRRVVEFGGYAVTSMVGDTVEFFTRGGECTGPEQCHTGVCQSVAGAGPPICVEPCSGVASGGTCVNGYACDTPCAAKCQTCARVPGVCTAVTSGTDAEEGPPASRCADGHVCVPGPTASAGDCKLAGGQACVNGAECASGYCSALAPNVCVDATCNQPCQIPQGGLCVERGRGAEPTGVGCAGLRCGDGGKCLERCESNADCVPNHYCDETAGKCRPTKEPGEPCRLATECKLPYCVDGVCCGSACDGACDECGKDGRCFQRSGGVKPLPGHSPCLGEGVCGGYCGGRTECIQPGPSTPCGTPSCFARDYVVRAAACDGAGACVPNDVKESCDAYSCDEKTGDCFRECTEEAHCRRGAVCNFGADGRGLCDDEDAECAGFWSVRTSRGSILGCDGYPCFQGACTFRPCDATQASECAPGYVCRDRFCVELAAGDAGVGADAGTRKGPAGTDGGDEPAPSEASSCAVSRGRQERGAGAGLAALSLAALLAVRRRRAIRLGNSAVPEA